jgi:hypothetical protein
MDYSEVGVDGGGGGGALALGGDFAGGVGMVSGPVWPQAASRSPDKTTAAMPVLRVNGDFTIRITV